ncbi:MAG: tRNA epoxyqueuosine(34) reductase QueG [Candidatus Acidiferrales bacterium]
MHHGSMLPDERTRWICERARAVGFDLCGVAPASAEEVFPELGHLPEWLARGYAGEMTYLRDPRRADPRRVLEGARSVIVVAANYHSEPRPSDFPEGADRGSARGWISRYAWGDDYHEVIQTKLRSLIGEIEKQFPEPFAARAYTDTGPIIERVAAKYAGLGWLAKNTLLINAQLGSWLFLGVIVTTLDLAPSVAAGATAPADLCGSCTRCMDACPTQAFPEPYVLDARRCISYLTIELRGAIPEELRPQMGRAVIGCDICQDVCPWNRKAPITSLPAFQPREIDEAGKSLAAPELEWLGSLSQQEFSAIFRGSAVKRAKWRGLVRNACVALGNSGVATGAEPHARALRLLERLASSNDALISEHALWALTRLSKSGTSDTGAAIKKLSRSSKTN